MLEEGVRTANVVQSEFDEATKTLQKKTVQHQVTMSILQDRMVTSIKSGEEMTKRVSLCVCCREDVVFFCFCFFFF